MPADIADEAQRAADLFRDAALGGRRPMPTGPAATNCEDCGDTIPEARRAAMPGATCCTFCQDQRESRR